MVGITRSKVIVNHPSQDAAQKTAMSKAPSVACWVIKLCWPKKVPKNWLDQFWFKLLVPKMVGQHGGSQNVLVKIELGKNWPQRLSHRGAEVQPRTFRCTWWAKHLSQLSMSSCFGDKISVHPFSWWFDVNGIAVDQIIVVVFDLWGIPPVHLFGHGVELRGRLHW